MTQEFARLKRLLDIKREEELDKRRALAWQKAREVASFLRDVYGVQQVILYGSLARGDFQKMSDIDLYIRGFEGPYWQMLARAGRLAAPFDVSIVCAEDALPSLQEEVAREGVEL
ncbi:nucleotidyltransferase family protein [Neomoorella thermoacetica]|uniref:DNA polymerase, beta-like region n=1 Tax=Moorella thermoacetica (strain ATCC 39073 / JCM 9320) TaxID=264732 RepID=Q2RG33_MOOTA|nr:nucleotidyltransferase domain-containing protein [Moorella thermoacetica]AKX95173.1 nucleotidyltransferase domain protein [Moorella thermoacetica]AKX97798.1 nucleotidyltransferase domain protein [Moorella thermoacetica]OIQ12274.1 nucleotidyltransferase domain protein [Moorella thermoacetica]OIQ52879.1 nucleotidyltransferase domain protein [Moorella thermoacetica]OIQ56629.1 nucleotidyltransferase domain protein [Moorella thermoacetica]